MEKTIDSEELSRFLPRCGIILDVRSPGEFEEDHIPGAENIPMLDDAQRARVGALYNRDMFEARKLGARYAIASIHQFLDSPLIEGAGKKTKFLVYCARGGQRSGSLSVVLSQIGFPVFRLKDGYKTYRGYVLRTLEKMMPSPVYVLHGYTGSQKTHILHALADHVNVLDLEGAAKHRGSLLGDIPGMAQPSQKAFETELFKSILSFNPGKPTLIEGESRKIGRCSVPNAIWRQMTGANHLWLDLPRKVRIETILRDYRELRDRAFLKPRIPKLARYLSREKTARLHQLMEEGRWTEFVEILLAYHYDPLYRRSRGTGGKEIIKASNVAQALAAVGKRIGLSIPILDASLS